MIRPPSLPFAGYETVTITLTLSEREIVMRPIVGDGGHKRALVELQAAIVGDTLTLDGRTIDRLSRYAYRYGHGGYQCRFRAIVAAARRAGWIDA